VRIPDPVRRLAFAAARRLPPGAVRAINLARGIDAPRPVDLPPGHRIAVIAPHPDDELVGAGGTLAKHHAAGHTVRVVMVTSGEASASFAGQDPASARSQREAEAARAGAEVGLNGDDLVFLRIPDAGLNASPSPPPAASAAATAAPTPPSRPGGDASPAPSRPGGDASPGPSRPGGDASPGDLLAAALAAFGPDLVYCPSPGDGHPGHAAVARMLAAVLDRLDRVEHVALYEVMTPIYPTVVVDITEHMAAKRAGLGHYASALASFDIVRIAESLSAFRSVHALHGRGYAEAFILLRPAQFADLVAASG
jgi:N-acetylglucosamine malate deacetylase 1